MAIKAFGGVLFECETPSCYKLMLPPTYGSTEVTVKYTGQQYGWRLAMFQNGVTKSGYYPTRDAALGTVVESFRRVGAAQ